MLSNISHSDSTLEQFSLCNRLLSCEFQAAVCGVRPRFGCVCSRYCGRYGAVSLNWDTLP